jgi:hypothetical protein
MSSGVSFLRSACQACPRVRGEGRESTLVDPGYPPPLSRGQALRGYDMRAAGMTCGPRQRASLRCSAGARWEPPRPAAGVAQTGCVVPVDALIPLALTSLGLGADRKAVRNNYGPLSDAANARRSHPSPILGSGANRKAVLHDYRPLSEATNVRLSHPAPILGEGPGERANKPIPTLQTISSPACSVRP